MMTVPIAEAIVGGIGSANTKMPCRTFGLDATDCRTGAQLHATGNLALICASCYALRGRQQVPNVKIAYARRKAGLDHPQWPDAMAYLINAYERGGYFRWFDSGDLQSVEMLDKIMWVASRTPTVRHWLPTNERGMVLAAQGPQPDNLVIRVSAYVVGQLAGIEWRTTSSVHAAVGEPVRGPRSNYSIECPAYRRDHACGSCRACWSPKVANVSYLHNAGLRKRFDKGRRSAMLRVLD